MAKILYISYDGVLEPLGQSQVLAYLQGLSSTNEIVLISFEKSNNWKNKVGRNEIHRALKTRNISWLPLRYHKSPTVVATAFDIIVGIIVGLFIAITRQVNIIHTRSYVPTLMGLTIKQLTGAKLLFDMRGFWADERVDGGLWLKESRIYRITKFFEKKFFISADYLVTLTKASLLPIEALNRRRLIPLPISIIPTCADLERFRPSWVIKNQKSFTLGYIGSVGTWYLLDEMLEVFQAVMGRYEYAKLLFINRLEHSLVREAIARFDIDPARIELVAVDHAAIPGFITQMDAGLMLIKPCFSKLASAPTKLAEYLGCGVPCVGNVGVGDVEEILEKNRVGVVLRQFNKSEIDAAVDRLEILVKDSKTSHRCRMVAKSLFSLENGIRKYDNIYSLLST